MSFRFASFFKITFLLLLFFLLLVYLLLFVVMDQIVIITDSVPLISSDITHMSLTVVNPVNRVKISKTQAQKYKSVVKEGKYKISDEISWARNLNAKFTRRVC